MIEKLSSLFCDWELSNHIPELAWTQVELASRLMVSRQTVSDLLLDKKRRYC